MRGSSTVIPALLSAVFSSTVALTDLSDQTFVNVAHVEDKVITPSVSAFVKDVLNQSTIPGLSMGVVRLATDRQPLVELAAWGRRTEEGDGQDLAPDTLFAIASCSKAFLATSVGLLIDDYAHGRNVTPLPSSVGTLDWDTKVRDLLQEDWELSDEWMESKISLRDALSHMSGLPRHEYSYRHGDNATDVLRRLKHLSPAYELREQFMYNNQMYMVVEQIVSRLTNGPYPSFVDSRIFAPLNMTSSTFSPSIAARTGKLTQTWTRGVRRIPFWFEDDVAALFAGPGGAISSAEDMTKWLALLLNEGVIPRTNETILPRSVLAELTTAGAIVNGAAAGDLSITGYGMGWFRVSYKGHDVVWHSGAIPGFSLMTAFLPRDNLGVVLLANMDDKESDNLSVLYRVIDEALNLPPEDLGVLGEDSLECNHHDTLMLNLDAYSNAYEGAVLNLLGEEPVINATSPENSITSSPPTSYSYDPQEPLALDLEAYAGTYENVAYGSITLCAPTSTSAYCSQVLQDFAPVDNSSSSSSEDTAPARQRPTLSAAWERVWSSHMRLRHTSAGTFIATFPVLFPRGFGADTTPFQFWDFHMNVGRAEFVVREDGTVAGFALITEEQAAGARAKRNGGDVMGVGDAWYARVR